MVRPWIPRQWPYAGSALGWAALLVLSSLIFADFADGENGERVGSGTGTIFRAGGGCS